MNIIPKSENPSIKCFADIRESYGEILARMFADFRPLIPGKVAARNFTKFLYRLHEGRNKFLSPRDSGSGGPKTIDVCDWGKIKGQQEQGQQA